MTTDELLAEIRERGFQILLKDNQPILRGDKTKLTPTLRAVLRWHRDKLIAHLTPKDAWRAREWSWLPPTEEAPPTHRYTETPDNEWLWAHAGRYPVGARWWRYVGDDLWHEIPREEISHERSRVRETLAEHAGGVGPLWGDIGSERGANDASRAGF